MKKKASVVKTGKTKLSLVKNKLIKRKKSWLQRTKELKQLCQNRGVVYINHIPHGFYEEQLFQYFKQFGKVTAVKVPRSNKTGNAKGCAFVEFEDSQVAQVAADAMNNYLMFDCILKTKYIPPEEQKPTKFDRNGKPWMNRKPTAAADLRREKDRIKKEKPVTDVNAFAKKVGKQVARLHKKLSEKAGIDYEFQINDDVQILKVTKKPEDDRLSPVKDNTDGKIKVKKLKKTSRTNLAQAAVKKAVQKGTSRLLRTNTTESLKNASKAVRSNAKMVKNTTKTALKNTTKKVLASKKKEALKNATKKVLASKKTEAVENKTKNVLKDTKKKIVKKRSRRGKKVTAV